MITVFAPHNKAPFWTGLILVLVPISLLPNTSTMEPPNPAPGTFLYRIQIGEESFDYVHQISELEAKYKIDLTSGEVRHYFKLVSEDDPTSSCIFERHQSNEEGWYS